MSQEPKRANARKRPSRLSKDVRLVVLLFGALLLGSGACADDSETRSRFDDEGGNTATTNGSGGSGNGNGGAFASSTSGQTVSSVATTGSMATGSIASSSTGAPCNDPGPEPNETLAGATNLGTVTDCDSMGTMTQNGVLKDGDVDWYKYAGSDDLGCSVDPTRVFSADSQARLCKYAECAGLTVTCPSGTTPDSVNGIDGCCSTSGFALEVDCNGISDDATIYLRLDKPQNGLCVGYSLEFHY